MAATIVSNKKRLTSTAIRTSNAVITHQNLCKREPTGINFSILALAYYNQENYAMAAYYYCKAISYDPMQFEWREMYALARQNAQAEINVTAGENKYFNLDTSGPDTPSQPKYTFAKRYLIVIGNVIGILTSTATEGIAKFLGNIAGDRRKAWTN